MKTLIRKPISLKYCAICFILLSILFYRCTNEHTQISELYTIEKMFYTAEKAQQNILINPDIATKEHYSLAEHAYREIIKEFSTKESRSKEIRNYIRQSWMAIGKLYRLQQEYNRAIEIYQEIIKKSSEDEELCALAQFAIANSYERSGHLNEAIASYKLLIDKYPPVLSDTLLPNINILQTPNYISWLYRQQNKNILADEQQEKSRRYLRDVIQKWPQSMIALTAEAELANSFSEQGYWEESAQILDNAIRQYQARFEVFNLMLKLGSIYEHQLSNPQKALYIYQRILNTYPDHANIAKVYLAKGGLYVSQRKFDDARSEFKRILDNYPNIQDACIQAQLAIGKTYEMENNWNKALNEYQWVLEAFPRHPKALDVPLYIANYYRINNEKNLADAAYTSAIKHYKGVVSKYPDTMLATMAMDHLSTCYVRLDKWQQAAEALESMLKMKLSHPKRINSTLALAGMYEEKLNSAAKALEKYSALLNDYPNIPLVQSVQQKTNELKLNMSNYQQYNTPPQKSELYSINESSLSSVEIKWRPSSDNDFSYYRLYRAEDSNVDSTDKLVQQIYSRDQSSYVDDSIIKGKKYYYRLYTYDNGGLSSASNVITTEKQSFSQISEVQLNGNSSNWSAAHLSWTRSDAPDFDSYKIYRSENSDVSQSSHLVKSIYDSEIVQFLDNDLEEEKTYTYKIFVYNRSGANKPSNSITITTGKNIPPTRIQLARPIVESSGHVKLHWNQCNDPDFSMYRIYRGEKPNVAPDQAPLWMSSSNTTNDYTDSNIRPGKTYYYKIVVIDKGGLSSESNEVSITL